MNKLALVCAALTVIMGATTVSAATYVRWGDVDGSAIRATTTATAPARVTAPIDPQEAGADYLLEIDGVKGESKDTTNSAAATEPEPEAAKVNKVDAITIKQGMQTEGKVEQEWKVEEGESAAGKDNGHKNEIEILSNSATDGPQPLTPDFSILLGGGSEAGGVQVAVGDVNGDGNDVHEALAEILKQGMEEAGAPVEQVSLNYEKIKVKLKQELKLFGFIPVSAHTAVDVDARGNTLVGHPWWSFLASGKDERLGAKVVTVLSAVLETKHDVVKNAIANSK